jgi:disulfide oxidoreductase YuzD
VYCVVWSPTVEITFPINLPGAPDFMAWMERATGRKLPAPRYQPNF